MKKEEEREKKLNILQEKHRRLLQERIPLVEDFKKKSKILDKARRLMDAKSKELRDVGGQIYDMKHNGSSPHVTDHAVVRYLERVDGVDIWDLRHKVAEHSQAVREGNVIVTVNEDLTEVKS
jgi:hypothetical protein